MEHIEYEERVLITKKDYQTILKDIQKGGRPFKHIKIENVYLDNDESFIYKTKKMLRIRTIDNKEKELTLKIKNKDNSCIEINETLDNHPLIDKELNNEFAKYHPIAKLETKRVEIQYEDYLFVIDENKYQDVIDYDIEVETSSQEKAKEIIKKYCDKYNLKYDPNYKSKSHRAIARVRKDEDY